MPFPLTFLARKYVSARPADAEPIYANLA